MAILNPTTIRWVPPTQYEDGSAFGAADFAGYEWGYREGTEGDFTLTVAVPVTFDITELDISTLALPRNVDLDLVMRTVASNGLSSEWTTPISVRFDNRRPLPPAEVAVG